MSDAGKADGEKDQQPAEDDVRRRFREALERKNKASHASGAPEDGKGVGPAVNNTVTRREFRRKSG